MMGFLGLVIIGTAAGFIASRLMGEELGLGTTVAVGILGAVLGWVALRLVMAAGGVVGFFVAPVIGAVVVIWIWREIARRR